MKLLVTALTFLFLLAACTVSYSPDGQTSLPAPTPGTPAQQQEAVAAAREYTAMIDDGQYSRTWERAGPTLKGMTNEFVWTTMLKAAGKLIGGRPTRQVEGLGFTTQVDVGGPVGDYAVVLFKSRSGQLTLSEKVVMQKVGDAWLIVGYFVEKHRTFAAGKD